MISKLKLKPCEPADAHVLIALILPGFVDESTLNPLHELSMLLNWIDKLKLKPQIFRNASDIIGQRKILWTLTKTIENISKLPIQMARFSTFEEHLSD